MMNKQVLSLFIIFLAGILPSFGQDTLPNFSVTNVGNNRIIVGWTNPFESIKQLSIQRSFDSLKGYKTIVTVPDPTTPQNGYADTKATNDRMFYRLYIMLDKGAYLFSPAKRPVKDSIKRNNYDEKITRIDESVPLAIPNFGLNNNKSKPDVFTPSVHVYTFRDGYVRVNLPDDEAKKYNIKFFTEEGKLLFELKDIKERSFKIDKGNFFHAGWFNFELYEDGILKEKHKFFLQKEF
jgi:hypothetical protein